MEFLADFIYHKKMNDTTIYRIINKKENSLKAFNNSKSISAWLLGKYVDDYIFLKEDRTGIRLVVPQKTNDVTRIEFELEIG